MGSNDYSAPDAHYHQHRDMCVCSTSCLFDGRLDLSRSFASKNEVDRINIVRAILLAVASLPGEKNQLFESRKRKERDQSTASLSSTARTSVTFAMKGHALCRNGFLAITQISWGTLQRHASEVSSKMAVYLYATKRFKGKTGKMSIQTTIALAFLKRYSELHGLPCPRGRIFSDEEIRRYLPSGISKSVVFQKYQEQWSSLASCSVDHCDRLENFFAPLNKSGFYKVWNTHYNELKVSPGGTDYCDTCVSQKNYIKNLIGAAKDKATKTLERIAVHGNVP